MAAGRRRAATGRAPDPTTDAAPAPWLELATAQAGVVTRAQLLALGLSPGVIDSRLAGRRWAGLHLGVYATFTGPVPPMARAWAALLAAGDGAALGGRTALWLWGVLDLPGSPPRSACRNGGGWSPRRACSWCDADGWPAGCTRPRCRPGSGWRRRCSLLDELLDETVDGVASALERRDRRGVERAHGLPRGERNAAEHGTGRTGASRTRYRDVRYRRWRVVVELDGREAHPDWLLRRDRARDNSAALDGDRVLVYGWHETVTGRCQVAAEVARMLWSQGWRGTPRPCGDGCPVTDLLSGRSVPHPGADRRRPGTAES